MRSFLLIVAVLSFATANSQIKKQTIESKIDKVTIFLQGAQVQRTAKATISPGKTELVFANISPQVDKQSIQVKADGKLTVLSVTQQMNHLKEQETQDEIKQIEQQRQSLMERIEQERNLLKVYEQEEAMLLKNQDIKGDQALLKAADLKEAMDFQRQRLTEIYSRKTEYQRTIKRLESDLDKLNRQLIALNQKKDLSTSEIIVTVTSKENTSGNFVLTYLVRNAGWYPTYDIRVKDISSPIDLQTKANVRQSSGEDWKDIKLFLSTGNPNENNVKPDLAPWFLRYVVYSPQLRIRGTATIQDYDVNSGILSGTIRDGNGNPIVAASIVIKGTSRGTTTNSAGFFSIAVPEGNIIIISSIGMEPKEIVASRGYKDIALTESKQNLEEVVVTGYAAGIANDRSYKRKPQETTVETITSYQPTTTIYEIAEPYSVPNDGKTYTVDMDNFEVNALYEYYAAPKLEAEAFLTAKVVDWQELNLLPGEANLFFEGTFLGKTIIDVKNAGDTLNLSLGNDKGVIVKRTLLKEFSQKKFLGSNKTDTRQYEILVRNNKQQPVNIVIEDQLPISTSKEIEIDNKEHPGAKLDDQTQKLTWQPKLDPKSEVKLNFRYSVRYPKERVVNLD